MIVVTGAAGRQGRLVTDRLLSDGQEVVGTDRVPADSPDFRFVLGDLSNRVTASDVIRGADCQGRSKYVPLRRSKSGPPGGDAKRVSATRFSGLLRLLV